MANPQLENGHLRIANEVWEHLMGAGLNGTQWAIVAVIIRKTWGFRKKAAPISLTEFTDLTGHGKRNITRGLSMLILMNIIQQSSKPNFHSSAQWAINKDWESWEGVKPAAGGQIGSSSPNRPPTVVQTGHPQGVKQATIKRQVKNKVKDKGNARTNSAELKIIKAWNRHKHLPRCRDIKSNREAVAARLKSHGEKKLLIAFFRYDQVLGDKTGQFWQVRRSLYQFLSIREGAQWLDKCLDKEWEKSWESFEKPGSELDPERHIGSQEGWEGA